MSFYFKTSFKILIVGLIFKCSRRTFLSSCFILNYSAIIYDVHYSATTGIGLILQCVFLSHQSIKYNNFVQCQFYSTFNYYIFFFFHIIMHIHEVQLIFLSFYSFSVQLSTIFIQPVFQYMNIICLWQLSHFLCILLLIYQQ